MTVPRCSRSSSKQLQRTGEPPQGPVTKKQKAISRLGETAAAAASSTPESSLKARLRRAPPVSYDETRRYKQKKTSSPPKTSQNLPASSIVEELPEDRKYPFSTIPKKFESIHSQHSIKSLKVPIADTYQPSIEEKGYDPSVVRIATVSEHIGMGVFAAREIKKGEFVGIYSGLQSIGSSNDNDSNRYVYEMLTLQMSSQKRKKHILQTDAERHGNFTCLFNDGQKDANIISKLRKINGHIEIAMFATKVIPQGHQLLIDYGDRYWNNLNLTYHQLTPSTYILELAQQVEAAAATNSSSSSSSSSQTQETRVAHYVSSYGTSVSCTREELIEHLKKNKDFVDTSIIPTPGVLPSIIIGLFQIGRQLLNQAYFTDVAQEYLKAAKELMETKGSDGIPPFTLTQIKHMANIREEVGRLIDSNQLKKFKKLENQPLETLLQGYENLATQTKVPMVEYFARFRIGQILFHLAEVSSDRESKIDNLDKAQIALSSLKHKRFPFPSICRVAHAYLDEIQSVKNSLGEIK